jgi:PQQ-dependent dehydrogenase (methanol/ethanol family)
MDSGFVRWRNAAIAIGVLAGIVAVTGAQRAPDYRKPPVGDWPVIGGDLGNTRYSPLAKINVSNVDKLKGAWMTRLNSGFGPGFSQQATPLVKDGVMYIATGEQDVFALDARTGRIIWEYRPRAINSGNTAKRGVALGEGMVFHAISDVTRPAGDTRGAGGGEGGGAVGGRPAAQGDAVTKLVALDQKTGKVRWIQEFGEDAPKRGGARYTTAAPLYYDGLIYMGLAGGDGGLRGRVTAHDAKTGREVWRFYTIPGPGEPGHDTWPTDDSWKTGGASVWTHATLDPDLGLVYVNTGNPWPGNNRPGGDNLYSCSVVALDAKTGMYRWHFQLVHHDIWDFDVPTPLILFDQTYNGQPRKGIAIHTKQGLVYILDRATGKAVLPIEEKAVPQEARQHTAATQPIPEGGITAPQCAEPVKGYQRGCMFTPYWTMGNIAQPSAAGDWAPGAYDPQLGYLFFTTGVSTRVWRAPSGGRFGPVGTPEYGLITALDSRTNKQVWQSKVPYLAGFGSGVLATGGGLIFNGGDDGNLAAFDSKTGEQVWTFQTGFGADAPAITYELDGEQYVAIASGGGKESRDETRGDLVWAFKLGGRLNPLNGPPPPPSVVTFDGVSGRLGSLVETQTITIGRTWDERGKRPGGKNEYVFGPTRAVVPIGTEVTFVNGGDMPHTATDQGGTWDTGLIEPGGKKVVKFDKPGEFVYFCIPHPWMVGQLVVR